MKKPWIFAVTLLILMAGFTALAVQARRSQNPHVLLERLRAGRGNMTELKMRLELARGDLIAPMIEAASDPTAPDTFRSDLIEMLFRQHQRLKDERVVPAMLELRADSNPAIRLAVMEGITVYGDYRLQLTMLDRIDDPDPEVRRQIYSVFTGMRPYRMVKDGLWEVITEAQEQKLLAAAVNAVQREKDPDLDYLARSIVGRKVDALCNEATRARATGRLDTAGLLLREALALDADSHKAQVFLVRHYLAIGDLERGLEVARKYGALLSIPRLTGAPVIDGDPTDEIWQQCFSSERFYHTTAVLASKRIDASHTRFHIGHDGSRIYIAVIGWEDDLDKLHVTHTSRDSDVWQDDCVEFYFVADATSTKFYQCIVNAANVVQDFFEGKVTANRRFDSATGIFKDRGYWCCEFAIEATELDEEGITPNSIWGFNVARVRIGPGSEHCQWWPTYGTSTRIDHYPIAVFEAE